MTRPRPAAGRQPGPSAGRLPAQIKPMLATAAAEPFDSPDHIFELKLDGVRAIAFVEAGEVRVLNRRLDDVRSQFPQFGDVPQRVKAKSAALDGEIVALDGEGRTSLPLLQERLREGTGPLTYQVFDILYLEGKRNVGGEESTVLVKRATRAPREEDIGPYESHISKED